jgi:uncharacterized protein (UPF0210 family)
MKIRSITFFCDPDWPLKNEVLSRAGSFIETARPAYEDAGYEVQTARLATVPFPTLVAETKGGELIDLAQSMELAGRRQGYDYVSLGPALPGDLDNYAAIPEALAATQMVFFAGAMSTSQGGVSLPAVRACAEVIQRAANISPDGFANLRFAALANVAPGSPFFPAAYHRDDEPMFALALQAADLAVEAFSQATSLEAARTGLVQAIELHARALEVVARRLEDQLGVKFGGIDFSLAPFPEDALSLGTALESLGVSVLGLHGSLAAAAFLADAMDRANFQRAGFSGLMLPVLEDSILARRSGEGVLGIKDMLLYSAVCGTGLDTIPLPGDTSAGELAALLLDIASLAQRLDKPLTARLMPIPGKRAGEPTGFDFAYFANSRVMALESRPLIGALSGDETFYLRPRSGGEVGD